MNRIVRTFVLAGFVLTLALPMTAAQAAPNCATTHTVQQGETLARIARRYSTTISTLQSLNTISNVNRIYAGQVLCVQAQPATSIKYTVLRGDTLASIARRYGVDMYVLAQMNKLTNLNRIYVGQVLLIPEVTIQ